MDTAIASLLIIFLAILVVVLVGVKIWIMRWLWKKYRRRQLGEGGAEAFV